MCDVAAAFSKMSPDTARNVSSISTQFGHLAEMDARKESAAFKLGLGVFFDVVAVSESCRWEQTWRLSLHLSSKRK